jgi:hypothetical protein
MNNTLLIDTQIFQPTSLTLMEGKKSERGNPIVGCCLATAEVENGNGRYYKKSLWEREIDKYAVCVKERRALGELDHPESSVINLKNASHNITELWWEGNDIMGKIEILPTPSGNILKALIESNIKVGVSSRGMGSLTENSKGVLEVQDDFDLLCWDFVSTPSNPGSWASQLSEGKNYSTYNPYIKVQKTITEILCSNGTCPVF